MADSRPEYPLRPDETLGADLYWLLIMEWGGRTYRWATHEVVIQDDDGNNVVFDGGLTLSVETSMSLFSSTPSNPIVSITDLIFPPDVDVALEIERGKPLTQSHAELSLWVAGRTLEQRWVRVIGEVTSPDYGSYGEPVSFDLEPMSLEDHALIPRVNQQYDDVAFTDLPGESEGYHFPIVYGKPGLNNTEPEVNGGSPAHEVNATSSYWSIALGPVVATTVRAIRVTATGVISTANLAVTLRESATGTKYSAVTWALPKSTDEVTINWAYVAAGHDGAKPRTDKPDELMHGAGSITMDLLDMSTIPWDRDRWGAIRDELDAYLLDFYIDEQVSPWEFIQDNIAPLLPISMIHGPDGVYPVLWRPDVNANDAVARLTAGVGLDRVSRVQYDHDRLANQIRVEYAPRYTDGGFSKRRAICGATCTDQILTNLSVTQSYQRYGLRSKVIESLVLYDDSTAAKVVTWQGQAFAHPTRTVRYLDTTLSHAYLEPGHVVTITDSELHWSNRIAWVQSVTWEDTDLYITLILIEDPARDARAT